MADTTRRSRSKRMLNPDTADRYWRSILNSHWFLAGHMDDHMISELWRAKKCSLVRNAILPDEVESDRRGVGGV